MAFTSPAVAERNAVTSRLVEETRTTLQDMDVIERLSIYAEPFQDMLDDVIVANVRNGVVEVPNDRKHDIGSLVIAAIGNTEQVALSVDFGIQTPRQAAYTHDQFKAWGASRGINDLYADINRTTMNPHNLPVVKLEPEALAITTGSTFIFHGPSAKEIFTQDIKGVIGITHRPLVLIGIDTANKVNDSELGHELAHAYTTQEEPVMKLQSQNSLNMWSLKQELFASGVGASIASVRLSRMKGGISSENIDNDSAWIQFAVEALRLRHIKEYGFDPENPYKPNGMLLKSIHENGLSNVLHAAMDYSHLEKIAQRYT